MSYQSKTWSLSDEVVAAVDAAKEKGESPNQFFRRLIRESQFQSREAVARVWDDDEEGRQHERGLTLELGEEGG